MASTLIFGKSGFQHSDLYLDIQVFKGKKGLLRGILGILWKAFSMGKIGSFLICFFLFYMWHLTFAKIFILFFTFFRNIKIHFSLKVSEHFKFVQERISRAGRSTSLYLLHAFMCLFLALYNILQKLLIKLWISNSKYSPVHIADLESIFI